MSLREALAGGGGVKSIQTGYIEVASASTGSGEDTKYTDVTISAVDPAKAMALVIAGGNAAGAAAAFLKSGSGACHEISARLVSGTAVRLATPGGVNNGIYGRWLVVEYK